METGMNSIVVVKLHDRPDIPKARLNGAKYDLRFFESVVEFEYAIGKLKEKGWKWMVNAQDSIHAFKTEEEALKLVKKKEYYLI